MLNSTAEFCRTLGDIPTYGKAGNREEEEDESLMVKILQFYLCNKLHVSFLFRTTKKII